MPILGGLSLQQGGKLLQGFPCVHHPGGVVGGVENHRLSTLCQHGLHRRQGNLEIGHIRGHYLENHPGIFRKGLVFRKIGGNGQNLAALHRQCPEYRHQLRGGTAAQKEILRCGAGTVSGIQVGGDGLPGFPISHGGGIAVHQQRVGVLQNPADGLVHLRRGGDGGVAKGEIKDIFLPHNSRPGAAVFKQIPDAGAVGSQSVSSLVNHNSPPCQLSYNGRMGS